MSEQDFTEIFSRNLRTYLTKYELTQAELAKRLKVSTTSVSNWVNGIKTPRMDKVDMMCEIFHCKRSDLMHDPSEHTDPYSNYYLDPETARVAQELHDDPDLCILFDAARDAKPETLRAAAEMIRALKKQYDKE